MTHNQGVAGSCPAGPTYSQSSTYSQIKYYFISGRCAKRQSNTITSMQVLTSNIPKTLIDLRCCELQPFDVCGIYFLVYRDLVVYIGKSERVNTRVKSHRDNKKFDRVYVNVFPDAQFLSFWESYYINRFKPIYNQKGNSSGPAAELLDDLYDDLLKQQLLLDFSNHYLQETKVNMKIA